MNLHAGEQGVGMKPRRKLASIACAFAALLLCMVLAACGGQNSNASSGAADVYSAAFTQKDVPVFRKGPTDETIALRFYEQTPSIAYISLGDYYKLILPQGSMDVEHKDDGTYHFTSHTGADPSTNTGKGLGGTAVVDPAAGTLTSPDLPAFTNTMTMSQEGMDNGYYDGMPFVRVSRMEYDKDPQPVTFDFARYGIALHADEKDVYLPFQTVSVIYSDFGNHYASYNGQKVYVNSDNVYDSMDERDPEFSKPILSNRTRAKDLADFSYNHIRFCIDYFDAVPSRKTETLGNHDIDATLDAMGEEGKALKEALHSTDLVEYIIACDVLGLVIWDGGHTTMSYANTTSLISDGGALYEEYTTRLKDMTENKTPLGVLYSTYVTDIINSYGHIEECQSARDKAYGSETYIKKGDTAVIVFDAFSSNYKSWTDYFAGKGERPNATEEIAEGDYRGTRDAVAIVSEGLARAKEDPEVKNVVLDVSNNCGGSLDVLEYIVDVVGGREYHQWQNTLTGQLEKEYFDVDRNLDGTFDEKDKLVDYSDLNLAVLTSYTSFSCGNLFPSVLADAGIMIMGERSGGGSCAVQKCVTADGAGWTLSSWRGKLINDAGHEIDDGIPVDVDLLERTGSKTTEEGYPDYSGFYDIDLLSKVMNEHFDAKALTEAA